MKMNGYKAVDWLSRILFPKSGDTPQQDAERKRSGEAILNALKNVTIEVPESEIAYLTALKDAIQREAGPEYSYLFEFE